MDMDIRELGELFLKNGFDAYAILLQKKLSNHVRFAVNKVTITNTWDETTLHILLEKEKRIYVTSIPYPLEKPIEEIIKEAKAVVEKTSPREDYAPLPGLGKYERNPEYDKDILKNPEKMIEIVEEVISIAQEHGAKRVAGSFYTNFYDTTLITSAGVELKSLDTNAYIDVRAFINKTVTGHSSMAGRFLSDIDVKYVARKAAEYAVLAKDVRKMEPGKYKTIFIPDAVATLFNSVGSAISAFSVDAGFSFLKDKLGKKVASDALTLKDIPLYARGYTVRIFDDEGVPTKNKVLIDKGELKMYVHNRFTAKKFNSELTGNAGWIYPSVWELEIDPGDASEEELLNELDKGLLIGNVTYLRFQNYIEGTFSAVIRDGIYYVENGEIKYAVKDLRLSDSMLNILKNIALLSKERVQVFHWWLEDETPVIAPYILVSSVSFTKAF